MKFKYFKKSEFDCPCCKKSDVSMELVRELDNLRDILGRPLHITSGYRCTDHNQKIGGAKNSYHLKGLAADIDTSSMDGEELYLLIKTAIFLNFSIGFYEKHMHLDMRCWNGKPWVIWRG